MSGPSDADVVGRFVRDGRLVVVPTRRHKRLLVLDHVAQSFEPGTSPSHRAGWAVSPGVR